ncbi:hypothetical protein PVAP13_5KG106700 [Panicum virgatum]|uniref:Dirigent protein n=1 Tax=Panicum virgatum TaxID=38727 RepID=A0A8T0SGK2_PANVG|nr:hypothetical protein PVAP13_5KG106700 [Panicum virgatum]
MWRASAPRPSPHRLLICGCLLLVLLVSSPHSSEARTSPADVDLAAGTLRHDARMLLGTANPVTSPPAPTSDPPVGPGLVVTPRPGSVAPPLQTGESREFGLVLKGAESLLDYGNNVLAFAFF